MAPARAVSAETGVVFLTGKNAIGACSFRHIAPDSGGFVEMLDGEIAIEGAAPHHLDPIPAGISSMRSAQRRSPDFPAPFIASRRLQTALKNLGYHEVGLIDGRWGSKTRGALLAFKADNSLPLIPTVDDLTWAVLARAKPR